MLSERFLEWVCTLLWLHGFEILLTNLLGLHNFIDAYQSNLKDPFYRDKKNYDSYLQISGEIETCDIIESGLDYSSPSSFSLFSLKSHLQNYLQNSAEF